MARAIGARAQMALGFETTYGTQVAINKFWQMPFASANIGAEQALLTSELLGFGRDPQIPIKDAIEAIGDLVVPIDARFWGVWLKAAFGEPVSTGTTPRVHTFQSGGWVLPSMSIEIGMPEVPFYGMTRGAVLNQLSWTMNPRGLITASAGLMAQTEVPGTVAATGTLQQLVMSRFTAFQGSLLRGGSALGNVVSAQVTYANNLDRIEVLRGDGLIDGLDPSRASLTGTIDVRFDNQTLLTDAINGAPTELQFVYQISASQLFRLTAHAVYLPRPRIALEGPGGVQASFAWQAARDATVGRMCTAVLINDVNTYIL